MRTQAEIEEARSLLNQAFAASWDEFEDEQPTREAELASYAAFADEVLAWVLEQPSHFGLEA